MSAESLRAPQIMRTLGSRPRFPQIRRGGRSAIPGPDAPVGWWERSSPNPLVGACHSISTLVGRRCQGAGLHERVGSAYELRERLHLPAEVDRERRFAGPGPDDDFGDSRLPNLRSAAGDLFLGERVGVLVA